MSNNFKIILTAVIIAGVFTQEKICNHLGFGQSKFHNESNAVVHVNEKPIPGSAFEGSYVLDDFVYRWDDQVRDWVVARESEPVRARLVSYTTPQQPSVDPIEVDWQVLMNIEYERQYFPEVELEMYAPVFPDAVKELDGKEVVVEGFVIPFDQEGEQLSLSFNSYASCFFCGKASPASVMSLYVKEKRKRYKTDDFKKFKGTLHLNSDDPNEFYYILRDATEI